jgi:hypothetical protein
MPEKLTEQATLICDKGTAPAQLKVTSQTFSYANDKLVATEQDKATNINIASFGVCAITRSTCIPAAIAWQHTTQKDDINGFKILTEDSTCMCSIGGTISVQHKGHSEMHETD